MNFTMLIDGRPAGFAFRTGPEPDPDADADLDAGKREA
jgi:hypothetical protein